jgi:tetratricopeptide (TPR) repeat protein
MRCIAFRSLAVVGLITSSFMAVHAQSRDQSTPQQQAVPIETQVDSIAEQRRLDSARWTAAEVQIVEMRTKVDTATSILEVAAGFLGVVLAIGTIASVFGFIRSEHRAAEAHSYSLATARTAEDRAAGSFQLAIRGESASQERAAEVHKAFLTGSKETLELVNATLTLAKEASERAAKTIELRARQTIEELDQEAQGLLASVPSQDDRALVADPGTRSNLRGLAHKVSGFEISRFMLPEGIQLTPACLFIRGMDHHLSQNFEEAFRSWRSVALTPATDESLKSLAWYWIGYEHNNLNRFSEAEQSFENALQHAVGARRFELQRIMLETRFFNKAKYSAASLIGAFDSLLASIAAEPPHDELNARRVKVEITLANVLWRRASDLRDSDPDTAQGLFERSATHYRRAPMDKWALFGLAEALSASAEESAKAEAQALFKRVRAEAIDEAVRREEPRTKVLARTTELICCIRVPEFRVEVPGIRTIVQQELGRVDGRLTVYSQIQRRNVTKSDFLRDLESLATETNPANVLAASA